MFYEVFEQLCAENRTSPSAVCIELGMSKTVSSYWKRTGSIPKREALEKIADRFGVTVDYLLGKEKEKPATVKIDRSGMFQILSQLTEDEVDELMKFAEFLIAKRMDHQGSL
jgi:transcriptional regulator with XRE-family HTH domain